MRIVLFGLGAYVASEHEFPQPCHFEEARAGWSSMPYQWKEGVGYKLVGVWERWDACWYTKLATFGYRPNDGGDGWFYPAMPALMRLVGTAVDGTYVVAGLVVSSVALVLALWAMHRLIVPTFPERVAQRAMLFLVIFPGALFLFAPFTESVFIAASAWAIDSARLRRWPAATALAALAALTRPVGFLLAVPLAWIAYGAWRSGDRRPRDLVALAPALAAPLATLGFIAYAQRATGGSTVATLQGLGSSAFSMPWDLVGAAWRWATAKGDPLEALNVAALVIFIGLVVVGIRLLPLDLTLYAAAMLVPVATRTYAIPLSGTTRYLIVAFPAFIVAALLAERRRLRWLWATVSLLFLAILVHAFVRGDFVG